MNSNQNDRKDAQMAHTTAPSDEQIASAVQQIAMFQQRLDALEHGIVQDGIALPTWEDLVALNAQESYLRDAQRLVDAFIALGWAPTQGGAQ